MASDDESAGSPLSSIGSEEFTPIDEDDLPPHMRSRDDTISVDSPSTSTPVNSAMHPSKRRRIERAGGTPLSVATVPDGDDPITFGRVTSPAESISSDSSGDVPNSPSFAHLGTGLKDDDDGVIGGGPQVSACKWTGCTAGDLGNMDELVRHLHDIHMPHRQKKYSCEWEDCPRKGNVQASGYALRAHMRSHTREKPFYCALPECDRSFTRSDALAKHMRTVHETEALRPSDPIPKNHTGGPLGAGVGGNGNLKRIKLVFGQKEKVSRPGLGTGELPPLPASRPANGTTNGDAAEIETDIDSVPFEVPVDPSYYPDEVQHASSAYELTLPPSQLYHILRRQLHWAQQENRQLTQQLDDLQDNTQDLTDSLFPAAASKEKTPASSNGVDEKSALTRKAAWRGTEKILEDVLSAARLQEQRDRAEAEAMEARDRAVEPTIEEGGVEDSAMIDREENAGGPMVVGEA